MRRDRTPASRARESWAALADGWALRLDAATDGQPSRIAAPAHRTLVDVRTTCGMTTMPSWTQLPVAMLWLPLSVVVAAVQLPPEIQADRHLVRAERAIDEQDFLGAKAAMDAILELQAEHDLELPEAFSFRYAEVLERLDLYDEAVEHVTEYLTVAGRDGAFYREALELFNDTEAEQAAAEAARRRFEAAAAAAAEAEAQRRAEATRLNAVHADQLAAGAFRDCSGTLRRRESRGEDSDETTSSSHRRSNMVPTR